MFAFLILVTITLQVADAGPPRTFAMTSDDQYSPSDCEKRGKEAADRMGEALSGSLKGATVEIEHHCVLLETRKI